MRLSAGMRVPDDAPTRFHNFVFDHFPGADMKSETKAVGRCPLCNADEHLYITLGEDGKVLLYCQHCSATAPQIAPAVHLTMQDLHMDGGNASKTAASTPAKKAEASKDKHGRIVATREHVYHNSDGTTFGRKTVKTYEDGHKTAYWARWDAQGGKYVNSLKGLSKPLYALPALMGKDIKTVFVVEGEKDAGNILKLIDTSTATATSTPDGAIKNADSWSDNWTGYFDGKHVIVIADNDDAGRVHADIVARKVHSVAASVVVLQTADIYADVKPKGDISDIMDAIGADAARDSLKTAYARAEHFDPSKAKVTAASAEGNEKKRRRFIPVCAADVEEETIDWVWNPYIPVGEYTILSAAGGEGKGVVTSKIVADISAGRALPGQLPLYGEKVLFISSEDRKGLLSKRFRASGADMRNVTILDPDDTLKPQEGEEDDFQPFTIDDLPDVLNGAGYRLVIIDPLQAFVGEKVDLNRQNQMRPVLQRLAHYAHDAGCGILLIMHVNKRSQSDNLNNAVAGSAEMVNAARSVLQVVRDPEDEDMRLLVHTKSNYAKAGRTIKYMIGDDGGVTWGGFSEITRFDIENANRHRQNLREYFDTLRSTSSRDDDIVDTIRMEAEPGKAVNVTYKRLADEDAEPTGFWTGSRPSGVLKQQNIADKLAVYGITLSNIGHTLRDKGTPAGRNNTGARGFTITMDAQKEERTQTSYIDIAAEQLAHHPRTLTVDDMEDDGDTTSTATR